MVEKQKKRLAPLCAKYFGVVVCLGWSHREMLEFSQITTSSFEFLTLLHPTLSLREKQAGLQTLKVFSCTVQFV